MLYAELQKHLLKKDIKIMATIKLSNKLISEARQHADVFSRSIPKQIEHWSHIGKIAEENPDLPYNFIKDILLAQKEAVTLQVTPYKLD